MLGTLIRMVIGLTQKDDIMTQDETFFYLEFPTFLHNQSGFYRVSKPCSVEALQAYLTNH